MSRRLVLCADDYAQSSAISTGILQLIGARRLSATSVFSQSPHWPSLARELTQVNIDVGLHFNLTEPFVAGSHRLSYWLINSHLRTLQRQQIKQRMLAQIDAFSHALGRLPDYIDGHQHVHALPIVRQGLTDAIAERWTARTRPYVRVPEHLADSGDAHSKGVILKACTTGFARHAARHQLAAPGWFAGLYSFNPATDYGTLMRRWLSACPAQGLIMCHPGLADRRPDPIGGTRPLEYRYLASDEFLQDCAQHQIELARFS